MEKLEQEELKTEALQAATIEQSRITNEQVLISSARLQRLRQQKKFLKERKQKIFDKGLNNVEELERLEELEKA